MEGLEYLSGDSPMVCKGGGMDEDVIHVAYGFVLINKGTEDVVHHGLEGSWRVAQPEEHDEQLKESTVRGEGCLPLISLFKLDVVEPPTEIQRGKPFRVMQPGEHIRDQWKRVGVLYHNVTNGILHFPTTVLYARSVV